jgi:hypothetical protein
MLGVGSNERVLWTRYWTFKLYHTRKFHDKVLTFQGRLCHSVTRNIEGDLCLYIINFWMCIYVRTYACVRVCMYRAGRIYSCSFRLGDQGGAWIWTLTPSSGETCNAWSFIFKSLYVFTVLWLGTKRRLSCLHHHHHHHHVASMY